MSKHIGFYVWVFYPEKDAPPAPDKIEAMAEAITQFMTDNGVADVTVEHAFKVTNQEQPFVAFTVKTGLDYESQTDCDMAGRLSNLLRIHSTRASRDIFQLYDLDAFWSCYDGAEAVAA